MKAITFVSKQPRAPVSHRRRKLVQTGFTAVLKAALPAPAAAEAPAIKP